MLEDQQAVAALVLDEDGPEALVLRASVHGPVDGLDGARRLEDPSTGLGEGQGRQVGHRQALGAGGEVPVGDRQQVRERIVLVPGVGRSGVLGGQLVEIDARRLDLQDLGIREGLRQRLGSRPTAAGGDEEDHATEDEQPDHVRAQAGLGAAAALPLHLEVFEHGVNLSSGGCGGPEAG